MRTPTLHWNASLNPADKNDAVNRLGFVYSPGTELRRLVALPDELTDMIERTGKAHILVGVLIR